MSFENFFPAFWDYLEKGGFFVMGPWRPRR